MHLVGVDRHHRDIRAELQLQPDVRRAELESEQIDGRLHDAAELDGLGFRLALARHRQEGANDARASVRGVANALRPPGDERILRRFLEERDLADDDGKGIVELVGHPGEKRAEHRHFLALVERLPLADQGLLGPPVDP